MIPTDKQAGVYLHFSSLPGQFGIGEIGVHAHRFVRTLRAMGMRVWQFLPIGPVAYGNSPYQPMSIFAGNEMLISIDALIDDGLIRFEETAALRALPEESTDYEKLIPAKQELLKTAARRFEQHASADERQAFEDFLLTHDEHWLHNYALFRTLKTRHDERAWPTWEPQYVHRDPDALRQVCEQAAQDIRAIKVLQFVFSRQWQRLHQYANDRGVTLFGDIPIYIALDSADAWAQPQLLEMDAGGHPANVAGVPPDYFSADGQLWGNPLYDWPRHAESGFKWWIDRLRHSVTMADMVRLDHFRGFESYWSVPASAATARDGEWRAGPADQIFSALKAALGDLPIVAEDLGIITPEVTALRERWQLPGMSVLQFLVGNSDFRLQNIGYNTVCYTGTHDNDTTLGWFHGSPDDFRSEDEITQLQHRTLERTGGHVDTIHLDLMRLALRSDARLSIIPMQDVLGLGSEARMNIPGTTANNWRWRFCPRLHATVAGDETLRNGGFTDDLQVCDSRCQAIYEMIARSGRSV